MKRIAVGVLIGIVLTIGIQHLWKIYVFHKTKSDFVLFDLAKYDVEQKLNGSCVLDISISPDPKAKVNFVYDKLYEVRITYERDGDIKYFEALYAKHKNTWISPPSSELEVLDDKAKLVHTKKRENDKN
ncbi:MAG: hypothetical protein ACFFCW_48690 [Candidatus Hodarchaeota archaeon]